MKISRIVELMNNTEGTLKEVLHDYGHLRMTEERAGIVADMIELLDEIKDAKAEMREGLEGKLKAIQGTLEALE